MDNNFERDNILDESVEQSVVDEKTDEQTFESSEETEPAIDDFAADQEVFVAQKINVAAVENSVPEAERKGLRAFCLILVVAILLSCCSVGAYFFGKNSTVDQSLQNKPADADAGNAASVYDEVSPSVVGLYVYNEDGTVYNASGLVYSSDGYIITTDSIYETIPAAKFKVCTSDGKEYSATFVAGDSRSDVSVIKIDTSVSLTPITFGNSLQVVTGETVFSIGYSNGYNESAVLSDGIISAASTRVTNTATSYSSKMIQTTVGLNPGSFGGALVNEYGQVIGMLSTKVVASGYEESAYAVPSATIKYIADALIADKKVPDRARIGISYYFVNSADAEVEKLAASGLLVASVDESSELYGILKANDVITKINGEDIVKDSVVLDIIEALKPGDSVKLTVVSENGSSAEYSVKLLSFESTSSYSAFLSEENNSSSNDGTFDFPEGY